MQAWTWKRVMKCDGVPVLALSLRRPKPGTGTAGSRRMGRYYERVGVVWRTRWEKVLYPRACAALRAARAEARPFAPWSAQLDFAVIQEGEGGLALTMDAAERSAGPEVFTVRRTDTWDTQTGTPRTILSKNGTIKSKKFEKLHFMATAMTYFARKKKSRGAERDG